MYSETQVLVEVPIEIRIQNSDMSEEQKTQFLNMLGYFTLEELEELRDIL